MPRKTFELVIAAPRDAVYAALEQHDARERWLGVEHEVTLDDPPCRWEAKIGGHELAVELEHLGEATSLVGTVTVPGLGGWFSIGGATRAHRERFATLRRMVENGEPE